MLDVLSSSVVARKNAQSERQFHPGGSGVALDEATRLRIKERRLELELSQRDLAERVGTTAATISNIENNRHEQPKKIIVQRIFKAFGWDKAEDTYQRIVDGALEIEEEDRVAVLQMIERLRAKR